MKKIFSSLLAYWEIADMSEKFLDSKLLQDKMAKIFFICIL